MEVFDHTYEDYQQSLNKNCKNCNGVILFSDDDYCCGNCEKQENRWK
mgnify:CR=1 FL=1